LECGDLSPLFYSFLQLGNLKAATSRRTPKSTYSFGCFSSIPGENHLIRLREHS
jgi:hypothetical protein